MAELGVGEVPVIPGKKQELRTYETAFRCIWSTNTAPDKGKLRKLTQEVLLPYRRITTAHHRFEAATVVTAKLERAPTRRVDVICSTTLQYYQYW